MAVGARVAYPQPGSAKEDRFFMPTGSRLRSACQSCHSRGRYRPIELLLTEDNVTHWRQVVFCAACRSSWMDMTFGVQRFRGPRLTVSSASSSEPIADQVDGAMYPRRSRRRFKTRDLYQGSG